MSNVNQFDWVDFYEELADKLLQFKENRQELVAKVYEIYGTTGINMPTLEKDNQFIDIDPFTVFGLFNKSSMKESNRVKMVQFHQSYSYEDFIMGFRPSEKGFKLKRGSFYNFCKEAEIDSENEYFSSSMRSTAGT